MWNYRLVELGGTRLRHGAAGVQRLQRPVIGSLCCLFVVLTLLGTPYRPVVGAVASALVVALFLIPRLLEFLAGRVESASANR